MKRFIACTVTGIAVLAACSEVTTEPQAVESGIMFSHVTPTSISGNPTCIDLAGPNSIELKIDVNGVPNGFYTDGVLEITISNSDGTYFDWASNILIDDVVVKGGPNANHYHYPNGEDEDDGLHAPINTNTGNPYGLSHASFCYTPRLDISKTADTELTRTHEWDIEKYIFDDLTQSWVKTISLDILSGASQDVDYEVIVTKTGTTDSGWKVTGSITMNNPWGTDATVTDIDDVISQAGEMDVTADVVCPSMTVPAGGSLVCTYSHAGYLANGGDWLNTVTVVSTGIEGGQATALVDFSNATVTDVDDEVNIYDTLEGVETFLGKLTDSYTFEYSQTYFCDADEGSHTNIADIRETGQDDEATVTIDCIPVAFEACTPGFWRNHTDLWAAPYTPAYLFFTAFAGITNQRGFANDYTLGEAINQGGGQFNRVARHGTAALLSAASGDVAYPYTVPEVIAIVEAAFNTGNHSLVDELAAANEEFDCPL
jgi:hypothetical protein